MTETHTPLPCPFCGGEAQFHTDNGPTGECYGWVGCNQCDAMSLHCDVRSMQPEDIHPIDAWNTRADSHHDLIEALRGLLDEIGKSARADTILDSAAAGKAFAAIAEVEGRRG